MTAKGKKETSGPVAPDSNPPGTSGVTPVSSWKKNNLPLTLPSGNVIKCRAAGFRAFMAAGIIPNDLMGVVQESLNKGTTPNLEGFGTDMDKIAQMMEMVDNVVIFSAIEPTVAAVPTRNTATGSVPDDRDEDQLYIDEIGDEDKMFLFQWATGGTRDVAKFREQAGDSLAPVQRLEALGGSTQSTPID